MSPITTLAPSSTSIRACSAPIPRAPPLMSATLPSTRPTRVSFRLGGHQSAGCVQPCAGYQRQIESGPDTGRRRDHRRDGVDDAARGAGDRGVVVVALAAARDDVDGVRRLAGDLDAVRAVARGGL